MKVSKTIKLSQSSGSMNSGSSESLERHPSPTDLAMEPSDMTSTQEEVESVRRVCEVLRKRRELKA